MDESQIQNEIDQLLMIPFYLTGGAMVLELLAVTLLFASVIILFTCSKRPGRHMMLFGLLFATLSFVSVIFLDGDPRESLSAVQTAIYWYLPIASILFMCVACFGFFKFAISFKNDS